MMKINLASAVPFTMINQFESDWLKIEPVNNKLSNNSIIINDD